MLLIIFLINIFFSHHIIADDNQLSDLNKIEVIVKEAENGDANYQLKLAEIYGDGKIIKYDPQKAFYWYLKSAEQGNYRAQFKVGDYYYNGLNGDKNYEKACEWYLKSAKNGSTGGAFRVYQYCEFDKDKALDILLTASKYDDLTFKSIIERTIAKMYDEGDGIQQNYEKAYNWYSKASDHGEVTATTRIAEMYEDGIFLQKDNQKAIEMYFKALKQGSANYPVEIVRLYNTNINPETQLEIYKFFIDTIKNSESK